MGRDETKGRATQNREKTDDTEDIKSMMGRQQEDRETDREVKQDDKEKRRTSTPHDEDNNKLGHKTRNDRVEDTGQQ